MIKIGKRQTLLVDSTDKSGYYLLCEDNHEVFLPGSLAPSGLKQGEKLEVFVFVDNKGEEFATSSMPLAEVGDFACLQVKDVTSFGAFLDIGLPRDLLVPIKYQKHDMSVGEVRLVKVLKNDESNQLYGTEKLELYVQKENLPLQSKQPVRLIPFHKTELGFKVLIDQKYIGMIYHNEIFCDVVIGNEYEGTIKKVLTEGHVDAVLGKPGLAAVSDNSEIIHTALKKAGGRLDLWDKSSPDEIKDALNMSKKAFKSAVGILYKKRLIRICDGYIELI